MKKLYPFLLISKLFPFIFFFTGCYASNLTLSKLYIQNRNFEKAKQTLEQVIEENNSEGNYGYYQNDEVYYYLGVVNCELNYYIDGIDNFSKSTSISPKYENDISDSKDYYYAILFNQGVTEYENKNYDKSFEKFELALKFKPNEADALKNLNYVKQILSENNSSVSENSNIRSLSDSLIASYSGSGIQNTKPFKCYCPWEVNWYSEGEIFQIYLYDLNGEMIEILASESRPGDGSSFYPKEGTYYLKINAMGNWKINILSVK